MPWAAPNIASDSSRRKEPAAGRGLLPIYPQLCRIPDVAHIEGVMVSPKKRLSYDLGYQPATSAAARVWQAVGKNKAAFVIMWRTYLAEHFEREESRCVPMSALGQKQTWLPSGRPFITALMNWPTAKPTGIDSAIHKADISTITSCFIWAPPLEVKRKTALPRSPNAFDLDRAGTPAKSKPFDG